jgi:hypothetical protein
VWCGAAAQSTEPSCKALSIRLKAWCSKLNRRIVLEFRDTYSAVAGFGSSQVSPLRQQVTHLHLRFMEL